MCLVHIPSTMCSWEYRWPKHKSSCQFLKLHFYPLNKHSDPGYQTDHSTGAPKLHIKCHLCIYFWPIHFKNCLISVCFAFLSVLLGFEYWTFPRDISKKAWSCRKVDSHASIFKTTCSAHLLLWNGIWFMFVSVKNKVLAEGLMSKCKRLYIQFFFLIFHFITEGRKIIKLSLCHSRNFFLIYRWIYKAVFH